MAAFPPLYAAFDLFPSAKGAATHIDRFARTLFTRAGGGWLQVLGDGRLPPVQREGEVEIRRFSLPEPNFLRRTLAWGRYAVVFWISLFAAAFGFALPEIWYVVAPLLPVSALVWWLTRRADLGNQLWEFLLSWLALMGDDVKRGWPLHLHLDLRRGTHKAKRVETLPPYRKEGYLKVVETRPYRSIHRFLPLPRRFDDQFARARWARLSSETTSSTRQLPLDTGKILT